MMTTNENDVTYLMSMMSAIKICQETTSLKFQFSNIPETLSRTMIKIPRY